MHASDATSAAGSRWTIPADVAADGVDEMLGWFLPRRLARSSAEWGAGRTIHLHRTDGEGEWMVTIADPPTVARGHGKGDLAVRGPASDLLMWTMNRPAEVEVFGDDALAAAWRENVTF
jgi:predicted lipid carrier protein YhbT